MRPETKDFSSWASAAFNGFSGSPIYTLQNKVWAISALTWIPGVAISSLNFKATHHYQGPADSFGEVAGTPGASEFLGGLLKARKAINPKPLKSHCHNTRIADFAIGETLRFTVRDKDFGTKAVLLYWSKCTGLASHVVQS